MVKAMGAVPVMVPMPDLYLDLQKGVVDGALANWEALISFKLYETVKYITMVPTGESYFSIAMNNNTWNSLPPNVQQEINSVSGLQGSVNYGYNMFDTAFQAGPALAKKEGYPIVEYTPTQDQLAQMSAVGGKPIWDAWVKKMTANGHPEVQDMLNTELNLVKTYKPSVTH